MEIKSCKSCRWIFVGARYWCRKHGGSIIFNTSTMILWTGDKCTDWASNLEDQEEQRIPYLLYPGLFRLLL